MSFANAGHGPAFHLQRRTSRIRQLEATSCPIGVTLDEELQAIQPNRGEIEPGDLIVLATDGAIEQRDAEGEMFGRARFEQLVRENQTVPAPRLLEILKAKIKGFYRGSHPDDDVTILILERKFG